MSTTPAETETKPPYVPYYLKTLRDMKPSEYFVGADREHRRLINALLVVLYPLYIVVGTFLALVSGIGYFLLWVLFAPVRMYAKRNERGDDASEPPAPDA